MYRIYRFSFVLLLFLLMTAPSMAQSVSLGADFVSRYVWRGTDFGESASIQPSLSLSGGGFEIGSWASYSASADGAAGNEHDLWIGYSVETTSAGTFGFGITDYYFPAPGAGGFFNFDGEGEGSHWIEPYVSYESPGSVPINLYAAIMVHNDPDNSLYLEASVIPATIKKTEIQFTAGVVAGKSDFYGTEEVALVNLGISASREIPYVKFPVSVSYILNPAAERSFLVFGLSVSL